MTVSEIQIGQLFRVGDSRYVRIDHAKTAFESILPRPVVAVRLISGNSAVGQVVALGPQERVDAVAVNVHLSEREVGGIVVAPGSVLDQMKPSRN